MEPLWYYVLQCYYDLSKWESVDVCGLRNRDRVLLSVCDLCKNKMGNKTRYLFWLHHIIKSLCKKVIKAGWPLYCLRHWRGQVSQALTLSVNNWAGSPSRNAPSCVVAMNTLAQPRLVEWHNSQSSVANLRPVKLVCHGTENPQLWCNLGRTFSNKKNKNNYSKWKFFTGCVRGNDRGFPNHAP